MKKKLKYSIQEHKATHLHWDLRLEHNGVLKSWAIPKRPNPKEKRLAVQTTDHDIKYYNFEGTIPEGQYGAGTIKIWDKGKYRIEQKNDNKIVFELKGVRLKGRYCLVKTKFENKDSWLFFKL